MSHFWHTALENLGISYVKRVMKVSFVRLMVDFWKAPRDRGWLPVEPAVNYRA